MSFNKQTSTLISQLLEELSDALLYQEAYVTKHRLQFDFDDVAIKEIDALRKATALPNRAELIRQALRFLQWTLNETNKGATLLLEKDGKVREVIFPFWNAVTASRLENGTHEEGKEQHDE